MKKKIKIIDLLCYMSIGDYSELPEKFCFKEVTFKLNENKNYVSTTSGLLLTKYLDNDYLEMDLNSEIEILDEEDEFEDIEEIKSNGEEFYSDYIETWIKKEYYDAYCEYLMNKINDLIKNQRLLINKINERNDKND